MEEPQLLLQQLVAQVQALYDSTPGSAAQRDADKWLTGLVGLEGAWPVLLRVVGPAAGSGQASPFDVRLTFIAAKIMQLKIQRDWRTCRAEVRQAVQATVVAHLQQQALGGAAAPHDAPIVQNQLVLAFVHLLLQTLAETRRSGNGSENNGEFVVEICRLFGITGAPDLGTQLRPLLLLLNILKGLPEEHNRRGGAGGGKDGMGGQQPAQARHHNVNQAEVDGPLHIPEGNARTVVNLVGSVLAQCDAAEATALAQGGGGGVDATGLGAARRAKLAALQCLQAWAMYVMQAPAWVTLGDMAAWGLLPVLEAQVALAGTPRALEPEAFCTVLATITDGLRSMAEEEQHDGRDGGEGYYGPAGAGAGMNGDGHSGGRDGEERRRRREEVLRSVARVLLRIGRYVVQPGNAYAGDEDVPRSACEGLLTFLERHLEPLWARLGTQGGGGGGGTGGIEAAAAMVRELLQLLLAFTGHADAGGVALPTLELWVYLPEMLGLLHESTSASSAAAALLGEVQSALVEILARQCMGSPKWTAEEWRLALGGGGGGRGAARLMHEEGDDGDDDGEEEEVFGRLTDVLSFRSEAVDAAESMASSWPERHRVGELLYSVMAQRSGDPLAVEAVLWLLTGVARGLQRGAELMEDYGDDGYGDEEEDYDEEDKDGGYYGSASSSAAASSSSPDRAEGRRARLKRQRAFLQPQLWEAVIQGLASLQDPAVCVYLWHTAALLLHDLAGLFLAEAPPQLIEAASAFLLRALVHPVTCTVAAAALKHVCLRSCDRDRGAMGGRGSEPAAAMATAARLGGMITQALQAAAHARGAEGGAGGVGLLVQHPRAYADLTEALLLLTLRSGPEPNVDALVQIVTATIAEPGSGAGGFPRRADRALVLCAALQALHRGTAPAARDGGALLVDAVVERAWTAIDRSLFGPFDAEAAVSARQRQEKREQRALLLRHGRAGAPYGAQPPPLPPQQHPLGRCDELSGAVGACCNVLSALFATMGPGSMGHLLPLLLGKARSLLEYNAGALAAFREATAAQAGAGGGFDTRRAADEAGVLLWPGPLAFLRRVLRALWEEEGEDGGNYGPADAAAASHGGGGRMVQGAQAWWGLLQQTADAGLGLARAALELRVADEDEACGDPGRRQLLVRFYEEAFLLARDVASLGVPLEEAPALIVPLPPPSAVGADPYAVRRGLELVVLALEIPLENSASLKTTLSLLEALLRQQAEDALLPLLQGLPPRLVPALLRALVATMNLPSNIRRQIADLLHLLLCHNGGPNGSNNGPLPRASVLFQQAVAALLAGGEGSAALHALFAHDPTALAFVGQGLTHLATGQMGRDALREFVRCFAGLGRREITVEEAQEDMAAVAAGGHQRRGY